MVGERRPDPENQGGLLFSFMTIPTLAQALASRRFSASICHINEQTSGFSLTRSWLNFEAEGKEGCQFGGPPKPHPPPLTSKNQSLPLSKGVWVRALGHHPDSVTFECVTRKKPQFSMPVKWAEMSPAPESVLCKVASVMSDLCDPVDCSPLGSSVHGISQSRILAWVAIISIRGSSRPRDQTCVSCSSCISRQVLYHQCHLGSPLSMLGGLN